MKDLKQTTLSPLIKKEKELLAELPLASKRLIEIKSELKKIRKIKALFIQLYPEQKDASEKIKKDTSAINSKRAAVKTSKKEKLDKDGSSPLTKTENKFYNMLKKTGQNPISTKEIKNYNEKTIRLTDGMVSFTINQLRKKNRIENLSVGLWKVR